MRQPVQLGTVKLSRWRHWMPVWSSLIAEKRGADTEWLRCWPRARAASFFVTPISTRALRRWSMVYHSLLFFWIIQLFSSSARCMHVITHAIVKIRCKKETVESWRQSTRKGQHAFVFSFSFSFIFPRLWFVLRRSKCSEWLLLGVSRMMLVLRVRESLVTVQSVQGNNQPRTKSVAGRWDIREESPGSGSIQHLFGDMIDVMHDIIQTALQNEGSASTAKIRDHIKEETGEVVLRRTVCWALHGEDLAAKRRRPSPALMEHHNEARKVPSPPMKRRKDWNEKKVAIAITIRNCPIMTTRARSFKFKRSQNYSNLVTGTGGAGCVAAPIWPQGALRRSFSWTLINDVSDSISLSQAVEWYSWPRCGLQTEDLHIKRPFLHNTTKEVTDCASFLLLLPTKWF